MRRKRIQVLLATEVLSDEIEKLLPFDMVGPGAGNARQVLTATIERFKQAGAPPEAVYEALCGSLAAQLADLLKGTPAGKLSKQDLVRVQAVLTPLLTSKAGRPRHSDLPPNERKALSQSLRRERLGREGRKQINVWLAPEAVAYLKAIQTIHGCDSQALALELVLEAVMKGEILQQKRTET